MSRKIILLLVALVAGAAVLAAVTFNGRDAAADDTFFDPQTIALANAVKAGDEEEMARLVDAGANPNAQGKDGMTLLQWEILREGFKGIRPLVRLGADPSAIGMGGDTAMHLAARYRSNLYLKELVALGGDVNAVDGNMGGTPIYAALMANRQDNVDFLLANGARLDVADRSGDTPLHVAAAINDFDNVMRFLELGADPFATDKSGTTFQRLIFVTEPSRLNFNASRRRADIIAFLKAKNIPLDPLAER